MNSMHAIDTSIWIYSQDNRDKDKQQVALELVATTRPPCIDGGVTTLYTEDMANNSTIGSVKVINPFRP
jgi:predicted nucleic acid-binding protein